MKFKSKRPHYHKLRSKWQLHNKTAQDKLWDKHGDALRKFAVGSIGGLMLLSAPPHHTLPESLALTYDDVIRDTNSNISLAKDLSDNLPQDVRPLEEPETNKITEILSKYLGFKVVPELAGIRLNRNYGLIGGEQHLYRYPSDTLYAHADSTSEGAMYGSAGIAPGLGAWGYFAPSKEEFSEIDKQRERYYLAIQTFLAPGFAENAAKYRDFFKFRKILVVNPKTGQSVVAVIGDAGPAAWTGKHLGGSPEVMHFLGLGGGARKGAVLYFFIDDPFDKVPLGRVKITNQI